MNYLALFLDGRRIHPILRIAHQFPRGLGGSGDALDARQRFREHFLLRKSVPAKVRRARPVVAGERLFDDDVFPALERRDRQRLMRGAGRADVHNVHGVRKRFERIESFDTALARESLA